MFTNPPTVACATCDKVVFVSSAFPVKEHDTGATWYLCSDCYDKIGKEKDSEL